MAVKQWQIPEADTGSWDEIHEVCHRIFSLGWKKNWKYERRIGDLEFNDKIQQYMKNQWFLHKEWTEQCHLPSQA